MAVVTAEPTAQAVVENDSSSSLISGINVGDDMNEDGGTMNGSAELRDIETYVNISCFRTLAKCCNCYEKLVLFRRTIGVP